MYSPVDWKESVVIVSLLTVKVSVSPNKSADSINWWNPFWEKWVHCFHNLPGSGLQNIRVSESNLKTATEGFEVFLCQSSCVEWSVTCCGLYVVFLPLSFAVPWVHLVVKRLQGQECCKTEWSFANITSMDIVMSNLVIELFFVVVFLCMDVSEFCSVNLIKLATYFFISFYFLRKCMLLLLV